MVNVYFGPQSFGGATIVAEQLCLELLKKDYSILAVTSIKDSSLPDYHLIRYRYDGIDVVAVNLPQHMSYEDVYEHHRFSSVFHEIVESFEPDIAHLHSVQLIGAAIVEPLIECGIPYCITMHDCWWLCERQFMVDQLGRYCFQTVIDPSVCAYCVDESDKASVRRAFLKKVVDGASLTLYPSRFHKELYCANGVPSASARLNRNGVRMPTVRFERRSSGSKVVFGFVGGPGRLKGSSVMVEAFRLVKRKDYELLLVDAARNLGKTWAWEMSKWSVGGQLSIVDGYTQETMDEFFSRIDVLLFPSQWKESFGLTVREALARDVWVIATDGGGPVEDIEDGVNGEIIPIGQDPQPLASAIGRVFERDWEAYRNPHKGQIQTYGRQAAELDAMFREVLGCQQS